MLCSLLFCYTIFSIDDENNSTSCERHGQVLEASQLIDLFSVMNFTTEETGKLGIIVAGPHTTNYSVYVQLPPKEPTKAMVVFSNVSIPTTHIGCMFQRGGGGSVTIFFAIWLVIVVIVISIVAGSINMVAKRRRHHQLKHGHHFCRFWGVSTWYDRALQVEGAVHLECGSTIDSALLSLPLLKTMGRVGYGPAKNLCLPITSPTSLGVQRGCCVLLQELHRPSHQEELPQLDQLHLLRHGRAKVWLPTQQVPHVQLVRVQRCDYLYHITLLVSTVLTVIIAHVWSVINSIIIILLRVSNVIILFKSENVVFVFIIFQNEMITNINYIVKAVEPVDHLPFRNSLPQMYVHKTQEYTLILFKSGQGRLMGCKQPLTKQLGAFNLLTMPSRKLSFEKMVLRPFNAIRQRRKGYEKMQSPPTPPPRRREPQQQQRGKGVKKRPKKRKKKVVKKTHWSNL